VIVYIHDICDCNKRHCSIGAPVAAAVATIITSRIGAAITPCVHRVTVWCPALFKPTRVLHGLLFTDLFIYFCTKGTRFPRAINIKKEMKHVWTGHGAGSEIENVSARQAALNRWMATDKRWKRKAVSRGSVVKRRRGSGTSQMGGTIGGTIPAGGTICS